MNASVNDIAAFDIALDQGQLLGEQAQAEMLAPACSTFEDRQDLKYGLGWYVQIFEGLKLELIQEKWTPS